MAQLIPTFERKRDGSCRAWLRQLTVNCIRKFVRDRRRRPQAGWSGDESEGFRAQLEDPRSDLAAEWDEEHNRSVVERLYAIVRVDFQPQTWEMFRAVVLLGRPVGVTADEFGVSVAAVLKAKSRVLRRLRQEAGDLRD